MSTTWGLGRHEESFDLSVTSYTPQGSPEQQYDNLQLQVNTVLHLQHDKLTP